MAYIFKQGNFIFKNDGRLPVHKSYNYSIVATISGIFTPVGICFDPNVANNRFFVASQSQGRIYVIDASSLAIITYITGITSPVGLSKDPDPTSNKIYAVGSDGVYVLNTLTLTLTKVNNGGGRFITVDTDLTRDRILYTSGSVVRVIKRSDFSFIAAYTLGSSSSFGCEGIAFDPISTNNRFLLVNRTERRCRMVSGVDFTILGQTTGFSGEPIDILFNELEQFSNFLITDVYTGNYVRFLTTNGFSPVSVVSGFNTPVSIEIDPNLSNERYFVTNYGGNSVSVLKRIS